MSKVIGIDISKSTFDVSYEQKGDWFHHVFPNSVKGFKNLRKHLSLEDHCIMEASGPYYLPLAHFLFTKEFKVSVVNPLVIKRFSQMNLNRAKTDKKDARLIAEYGQLKPPSVWCPEEKHVLYIKQQLTAIQSLGKQYSMNKRQLESFEATGVLCPWIKKALNEVLTALSRRRKVLEDKLVETAKKYYKQTFERLQTIPGLGPKTAALLIVLTNNFQKFEHSRQLIAYVGLSPRIFCSGTSVRGKGHICKMGSSQARKQLYMCSWTAKFCNPSCKEMYERLKAKGKPERVIKIAIANKLLKQAFAVGKNQKDFDQNYSSKTCF